MNVSPIDILGAESEVINTLCHVVPGVGPPTFTLLRFSYPRPAYVTADDGELPLLAHFFQI